MEIGGFFEFERYYGQEYHTECLKLNTARNCIKYLIEARQIRKMWISRLNCSAVLNTCVDSGIEIAYYDLDSNFTPIMPKEYDSNDYVYIVNYYGQLTKIQYNNVILDNVQAFFQKPISGMDTIYTCRKFFGVTDGAYLYTNSRIKRKLQRDKSYPRLEYLVGRFEENASRFFGLYQENEERLGSLPLLRMSSFTENILRSIDYDRVKQRREENYKLLADALEKYNKLKPSNPIGPFAYPFLCENGDYIRKRLHAEKIYIAKLWPNVTHGYEGRIASNLLPITCDQRYDRHDLNRICNIIKRIIDQKQYEEEE